MRCYVTGKAKTTSDSIADEDDDYTDWVDRVAVQELAKEICGIELGE